MRLPSSTLVTQHPDHHGQVGVGGAVGLHDSLGGDVAAQDARRIC